MLYEFLNIRLDTRARTLSKDGEILPTTAKVLDTLLLLAGLSQNKGHFLQEKAVNIDSHRMQRLDERTWLPTNRCPKRQAHGGP